MAIAEPTINNITKYYVTDSELRLLADAIREEGGTTASLTYPYGFASAINNLQHTKNNTLIVRSLPPRSFNKIYSTTEEELSQIASNIKYKNQNIEPLTFIEDFIGNLVNVNINSSCLEIILNIEADVSMRIWNNAHNGFKLVSFQRPGGRNTIIVNQNDLSYGPYLDIATPNNIIVKAQIREGNIQFSAPLQNNDNKVHFDLNDNQGGVIELTLAQN